MNATVSSPERRRLRGGGLPVEGTSFVGRRQEVADVKRMLSGARMVTLTGAGGVGKTRLAAHVAGDVRRAFPDGVWLVELAELATPELLVQTLTEVLEIRALSARPQLEAVVEHLRDKRALVVLDNCEHLLPACAMITERLLRSAPGLRILVTSRQPLGVSCERMLPVPALADSDAVRLFTERARAVLPDFAVTVDNREAVERICRRLDGIPLAIELAAVRLRVLSAQQLLDRLDDRFRLLTGGSRAALPRHQTLRALIDWSYGLCGDQERLLWARASVFSGGLDLEAAERVCAGDGVRREEIADLVSALMDKSILVREEHPTGVRYRMLETIRQFGQDRLRESGTERELRRRYRDYYRWLAAEGRERVFGASQVAWATRLKVEHPNLRAALEHCFADPREVRTGLDMAGDLLYHWITSYYLGEGRRLLDRGLATATEPSEVRARALWVDSWLAIVQADIASAERMLEESRVLGERLGLPSVRAYVALFSGMIAMHRREAESAVALYEEAVDLHRAAEDPVGLALALIRLSLAHSFRGDLPRAISLGEECLRLCDAHEESSHRAWAMMALGIAVWSQGHNHRAALLEKESLRFNRSLGDPLGMGLNLEALAWIAAGEGRYQRAASLLGVLQTLWKAIGAPLSGYGLAGYHDRCTARTRQALGESAFRAALTKGAELLFETALEYALRDSEPVDEPVDRVARHTPLTRRETEIAQLVAEGRSNKDIAASLTIAQRTAEGHIEHILTKLGFHSRTEIADWMRERSRTG
ncbi:LuxR C-terminal-related transcriptional regulator [Planotetraspora sp. GP83]|uniref:ATP-binding protein n=1 Tax=Planotetraspora sp. GP83 TaxID=3156264 RepID=UPI0035124A6D